MGQICSICRFICCCSHPKKDQKKKRTGNKSWKEETDITPSEIPDSQLTEEFKVPDDMFRDVCDVFELKGYDYKNKEQLAEGGYAKVYKIMKIKDKKFFAVKEIPLKGYETRRDRQKFKNLKNEIFVFFKIKHKNIVELYDNFIINNICYLVLEFANSGTVEQEINKFGPMSEIKAKAYFIQISKAMAYLHLHDPPIAHRDLKLPNILIHIENNEKLLKVTDFGFSKVLKERTDKKLYRARRPEGTAPYMSPQMLMIILHETTIRSEDREEMRQMNIKPKTVNPIKADIWSLGVCLFVMISGKLPFFINSNDFMATVNEQLNRKRNPIDRKISPNLKDLLDQLFEPTTNKRIDISGVIKHQWLSGVSEVIRVQNNKVVN